MNCTGIYTGQAPNRPATSLCHWWAVEVSNLRPQQCECQFRASRACASEGKRRTKRAENVIREPLFTQKLHRDNARFWAAFPQGALLLHSKKEG